MTLTRRDLEILDALSLRVRLISLGMLADYWWPRVSTPLRTAAARMAALQRAGLIERKRVVVRPLPMLAMPVASWRQGERAPDFAEVSQELRCRWTQPARMTRVYVATVATLQAFGREKKPFAVTQATHDLGMAEVYLSMRRTWQRRGLKFIGEDVFGKAGEEGVKDPDGFLLNEAGERVEATEFGGRYGKQRLKEFHEHCQFVQLDYVMW